MIDIPMTERLHVLLSKQLGMDDEKIIARPTFKDSGLTKIGRYLGVEPGAVNGLINELSEKLRADRKRLSEDDGEVRYTWEDDALGNVTVRDSKTGASKFLNVKDAMELINRLDGSIGPEQDLLAQIMTESAEDGDFEDRELTADEMFLGASTFNFPWKVEGQNGFGTARFSGLGRTFKVTVISVFDKEGDQFEPSSHMMADIQKSAEAYVPEA